MTRMRQIVFLTLCVLAIASGSVFSAPRAAATADLSLKDLQGKAVHLRDLRGKRVVLNFWATWCVPCNDEMPMFVEVEKRWAPRGVIFIAASLDDRKTQKSIPDFLRKFQIDFPVWTGATGDDLFKLGMGEAVPATAFLDQDGTIVARVQGEIHRRELEDRLDWLTGGRSLPAPKALIRNL